VIGNNFKFSIYLALLANLPKGLYILPSGSFSFFLFIIFFNDFSETNYRADFRNLYIE